MIAAGQWNSSAVVQSAFLLTPGPQSAGLCRSGYSLALFPVFWSGVTAATLLVPPLQPLPRLSPLNPDYGPGPSHFSLGLVLVHTSFKREECFNWREGGQSWLLPRLFSAPALCLVHRRAIIVLTHRHTSLSRAAGSLHCCILYWWCFYYYSIYSYFASSIFDDFLLGKQESNE